MVASGSGLGSFLAGLVPVVVLLNVYYFKEYKKLLKGVSKMLEDISNEKPVKLDC